MVRKTIPKHLLDADAQDLIDALKTKFPHLLVCACPSPQKRKRIPMAASMSGDPEILRAMCLNIAMERSHRPDLIAAEEFFCNDVPCRI